MQVRTSVVPSIGFIDQRFRINAEEVDCCGRIRYGGFTILFGGEVSIIHYCFRSTRHIGPDIRVKGVKSITKYFSYHHGRFVVTASTLLLMISSIGPILIDHLDRSAMTETATRTNHWVDIELHRALLRLGVRGLDA